jgi:hypothetical protein
MPPLCDYCRKKSMVSANSWGLGWSNMTCLLHGIPCFHVPNGSNCFYMRLSIKQKIGL